MEKLILALIHDARRLQRYFQAHPIWVLADKPIKLILARLEESGRIAKWANELGEHDIEFKGRKYVKRQILADFLAKIPSIEDKGMDTKKPKTTNEALNSRSTWKLYTDRASSFDGYGVGLILVSPEGKEYTYTLRFEFKTTNNEAEYEALLARLRIAEETEIKHLAILIDTQLVANQVKGLFEARQPMIKQYLEKTKEVLGSFDIYTMKHVRSDQNKKANALSKLASMTFAHLSKEVQYKLKASFKKYIKAHVACMQCYGHETRGIDIVVPLPMASGGARKAYGNTSYADSMSHKSLSLIMESNLTKTSGGHKQGHRQRHEAKTRKNHQGWVDELPQALWAHRTSPKSNNGETPFSLTYGSGAVVPTEISVETERVKEFEVRKNDKRLRENLDILEERREITSIREAHYKQKLERYYNKQVRPSTFKPGTYVLRLNSVSKAEFQGKNRPTWEGPYVVRKAYKDGAYKLETLSGSRLIEHGMVRTFISFTCKAYYLLFLKVIV
ncbi:reverse transcriptase domain-containing protein [Tanacetum coccineum]